MQFGGKMSRLQVYSDGGLRRLENEYSLAAEPLSNPMASGQIHLPIVSAGPHRDGSLLLKFIRVAEALEV
jgi:hypothetical protein